MQSHPISQLFDAIEGPIRFGILRWAIEQGVFDLCADLTSADDVAQRLNCDPTRTLRACKLWSLRGI